MEKKPIHKYNGGLGATLCHNCRKIIGEGLNDMIYCEDCGPSKVVYHNRHRDKIIFEHIGDQVVMTGGNWFRYSYEEDQEGNKIITMVDPSGGPYIAVGNNLKDFWPKGEYQDLVIESIVMTYTKEDLSSTIYFKIKTNGSNNG